MYVHKHLTKIHASKQSTHTIYFIFVTIVYSNAQASGSLLNNKSLLYSIVWVCPNFIVPLRAFIIPTSKKMNHLVYTSVHLKEKINWINSWNENYWSMIWLLNFWYILLNHSQKIVSINTCHNIYGKSDWPFYTLANAVYFQTFPTLRFSTR